MDFKFCLLAPCSESPSLAMQKFRDDVITVHAHCRTRQFSVTINRTEQEGGSPAAILAKIRKFKPLLLGSQCIF